MSTKAWVSAVGSLAVVISAIAIGCPSAGAEPNGLQCPPRLGQLITITVGDIDCATASDIAAQYDQDGDKYQQIGPFTCYSGNAMTAPLLFQCVADTADNAEFGVYPG
jgi:hypothetical protein